jgi:hypothetical protein
MKKPEPEDSTMASAWGERPALGFYLLLVSVLSVNMLLWLDSFDRYLSGRYHIYLSQHLPEAAYVPSRLLQQALNADGNILQTASGDAGQTHATEQAIFQKPVMPQAPEPGKDILPASAVADSYASQVQPSSGVAANDPAAADRPPKVLFAGDSMMQGVAPIVISHLHKEFPEGVFVDVSRQSTGLTANRYFDWPAKIREECIRQDIRTVVIFLGPNDPWDIYEGKKQYVFPSEGWENKYRSRVDEVLDFALSKGVRIIWIGLPAMREERFSTGAKIENRIFREETKKYKFDYLPTEDFLGLVDAPYQKYVTDPKKGKLVVRAEDGIHFTPTGLRMISARVEELLRKRDKL